MKMKIILNILLFLPFLSFSQHELFHEGEIAFDGNDLISYYTEDSPLKGKPEFKYSYRDIDLYFANQDNLNTFKADPEKYMPAYEGWCAIALTQNTFARPNFNFYKVQEGELLFFEVRAFYNGKTAWEKNPEANKLVADKYYKKLADDN